MPRFTTDKILSKLIHTGDRLLGHTARKRENMNKAFRAAPKMGVHGIPEKTILRSERLEQQAKGQSLRTRVKAGVGATAAVTGGFLGLHKYQQHKDNKILERIDKMYELK